MVTKEDVLKISLENMNKFMEKSINELDIDKLINETSTDEEAEFIKQELGMSHSPSKDLSPEQVKQQAEALKEYFSQNEKTNKPETKE